MNWLRYFAIRKSWRKLCWSSGIGIFVIASFFSGSGRTPLLLVICPMYFTLLQLNCNLSGLNLAPFSRALSNTFRKVAYIHQLKHTWYNSEYFEITFLKDVTCTTYSKGHSLELHPTLWGIKCVQPCWVITPLNLPAMMKTDQWLLIFYCQTHEFGHSLVMVMEVAHAIWSNSTVWSPGISLTCHSFSPWYPSCWPMLLVWNTIL